MKEGTPIKHYSRTLAPSRMLRCVLTTALILNTTPRLWGHGEGAPVVCLRAFSDKALLLPLLEWRHSWSTSSPALQRHTRDLLPIPMTHFDINQDYDIQWRSRITINKRGVHAWPHDSLLAVKFHQALGTLGLSPDKLYDFLQKSGASSLIIAIDPGLDVAEETFLPTLRGRPARILLYPVPLHPDYAVAVFMMILKGLINISTYVKGMPKPYITLPRFFVHLTDTIGVEGVRAALALFGPGAKPLLEFYNELLHAADPVAWPKNPNPQSPPLRFLLHTEAHTLEQWIHYRSRTAPVTLIDLIDRLYETLGREYLTRDLLPIRMVPEESAPEPTAGTDRERGRPTSPTTKRLLEILALPDSQRRTAQELAALSGACLTTVRKYLEQHQGRAGRVPYRRKFHNAYTGQIPPIENLPRVELLRRHRTGETVEYQFQEFEILELTPNRIRPPLLREGQWVLSNADRLQLRQVSSKTPMELFLPRQTVPLRYLLVPEQGVGEILSHDGTGSYALKMVNDQSLRTETVSRPPFVIPQADLPALLPNWPAPAIAEALRNKTLTSTITTRRGRFFSPDQIRMFLEHASRENNGSSPLPEHPNASPPSPKRRTNPTLEPVITHVGPAIPIYQVAWPKERPLRPDQEEAARRTEDLWDLLLHRRLLIDLSFQAFIRLINTLEESSDDGFNLIMTSQAARYETRHRKYETALAVWFDPDTNTLNVDAMSELFLRVSIQARDILARMRLRGPRPEIQSITDGLMNGLADAVQGFADALGQPVEYILSQLPRTLDIQIEKGLDYPETHTPISPERAAVSVPYARIPASSAHRTGILRLKADLMSELRHLMHPEDSDEINEPIALYAFAISEGVAAARDIHLPYVSHSEFARRVVKSVDQILAETPLEGRGLNGGDILVARLSDFFPSIFDNLWQALPNHTILSPTVQGGLQRVIRRTNPTGEPSRRPVTSRTLEQAA